MDSRGGPDADVRTGLLNQSPRRFEIGAGAIQTARHQVKALEAELGVKLFNRERHGLVITSAGRDFLAVVRDAFDTIALGTEQLTQRQRLGPLTVSTSPDFAAKWLVHRLGRFAAAYPEIELNKQRNADHADCLIQSSLVKI